jgi:rod shape determining protein RodA
MSFLEYNVKSTPTGWRKILHLNWALVLLLVAVACLGFLMLFSVAGGSMSPMGRAADAALRPGSRADVRGGDGADLVLAQPGGLAYGVSVLLLLYVEFFGSVGMGAQRWIDLGFMRLQPSELTKITLVMVLAAYYDWLDLDKTSRPVWVLLPVVMIIVPVFSPCASRISARRAPADGGRRGDVPRRACTGPISPA